MKRRLAATLLALLALSGCDGGGEPASGQAAIAPAQAEQLYLEHCAICHGERGDGHGPRRGSLHAKPPDFRGADWRQRVTPESVRRVIREGRAGTDMPAWRTLDDAEVAGLAGWVLGFASRSDDD